MEVEGKVDFSSDSHQRNPYSTYAMMQDRYPVCRVEPAGYLALTRYDDVKFALKRYDLFSSAGCSVMFEPKWLSKKCWRDTLVFKDPPVHTKYRPLVKKPFSSHIIKQLSSAMEESAQTLIQSFAKNEFDFLEDFAYPFIARNFAEFIGVRNNQNISDLRRWLDQIAKIGPVPPDTEEIESMEEILFNQQQLFLNVVSDRRRCPRDDMVTDLVNSEVDGRELSDDVVVDTINVIMAAGFHAVINTMANVAVWLSKNPETIQQLKKFPHLLPDFIEEMLRINTGAQATVRVATRDVTMSGIKIPEGASVLTLFAAANRDPRHFPNPDEIDLTRHNLREHLTFGFGPHTCPGTTLARLELKVFIQTILQNCNQIVCDKDQVDWLSNPTIIEYKKLPISLL